MSLSLEESFEVFPFSSYTTLEQIHYIGSADFMVFITFHELIKLTVTNITFLPLKIKVHL